MAETKEESKSNEESVKLFVGQVPKHMTEDELLTLFKEFAIVDEVNIIKDKATRASRGCCFVICPSRDEADKAVNACHNKKTLPGDHGSIPRNATAIGTGLDLMPKRTPEPD
ncbi:cugbp elav-like protein family member 2-like protein [Trifolium pratense]|uniref:Cugbp elav-like protein family member 2-like protein n=1 Tax=Trifolium pratense TaxID=57577 RepID=A0A2K3LJG8_TRIPR|nr:cugbp elav-like protein family member 2-like protein [Trifolium pratense]